MKKRQLSNPLKIGKGLFSLFALFMLLLTPERAWAEETSTTYTFSGMTGSSVSGYTYDVPSTAGGESKIWRVKNFSATNESNQARTTSAYVLSGTSLGISNIFATSESATIIDFELESDFTLSGSFVSAEITYSTSSMSQCKAVVYKLDNSLNILTDPNAILGTSPVTLSLRSDYEDYKSFDGNKIALDFTFTTNRYDGNSGGFSIQSITITTTPTYYNLWIGETQVNSDNASNILANDPTNDGKVSFIASSNTLVLNGVEMGEYIKSSLDNLIIKFSGTNKVHDTQVYPYYYYDGISSTNSNATLTFEKDGEGSTILLYATNAEKTVIKGFASVSYSSGDGKCYIHPASPCVYDKANSYVDIYGGGSIHSATISGNTAYPLWFISNSDVCTQVTSSTITANVTEGTVTFDPSYNTLSLNGAKINGKILSAMGNLTLDIQGACSIAASDSGSVVRSANAGTLTITKTGDNASLQLNVPNDGWNEFPVIQGFTTLSYEGFNLGAYPGATYGEYLIYDSDVDDYDRKIYGLYDSNRQEGSLKRITNALFTTANVYPVWVAGSQVSADNKLDVMGDGKVSFDTSNNTLTLDGINITGPIFYNDAQENLTIALKGTNIINISQDPWYSNAIVSYNNTGSASLIIKKANNAENCSLKVNAGTSVWKSITGFSNVTWDGLNAVATKTVSYDSQNRNLLAGEANAWNVEFTTATAYNIVVGDVPITSSNASNVLGDDYSSVSYDDGTLTLKGARVILNEVDAVVIGENVENLTIHLLGYNEIGDDDAYAFKLYGNTALTFTTSEKMPGSLKINGNMFNIQQPSVNYQNGLTFNSENTEIKAETGAMTVTPLTGTDYYLNTDNGDGTAYMYSQPFPFEATKAEMSYGGAVVVSTPENATATELWTSLNQPANVLKYTVQFDWGTCTNKNVTVQVVGYNQQEEEPYGFVADNKTYSSSVALSTADADGIIELPITGDVTSEQLRLRFSSDVAFSFVPLNIGITQIVDYGISVGGTAVTSTNASNVLGDQETPSVVFTPASGANYNTLTLNGATLTNGIVWSGSDDLNITIVGTNSITTTSGSCITYNGTGSLAPSIRFERGSDDDCTLTLSCATGTDVITDFSNSDAPYMPESGFFWLPTTDGENLISATITSSPFSGGDGSDADHAFQISTPQDLMTLSTLYNAGYLYRKFYQLTTDINCEDLTGFVPIGNSPFEGSFDGNGKKISNLTVTVSSPNSYCGLFGKIGYEDNGSSGTIVKDLTLENCSFNGTNYCGAIAGHIEGGAISGCTVTNCIISGTNAVGGIVGKCDDSHVTVSGCKVTGYTEVSCVGTIYAGAIIGYYSSGSLSNNTYEYDVTTSTKVGNDEAIVKDGYTQRALGYNLVENPTTHEYEQAPDVFGGAEMSTKLLAIPEEHADYIVPDPDGKYYAWSIEDGYGILVAPGQPVKLNISPSIGYSLSSISVTYGTNQTAEITKTKEEDGVLFYKITEMPDADATLNVSFVPVAPTMASEVIDGGGITLILSTNNDNATIKYSVDYVDAKEIDVTDATYDAGNKPVISKPATVTAYISANDQTSATTTGKYFDSNPSPFRLVYGADPVDLILAPAIEDGDGISINGLEVANVSYSDGKVSSSTMGRFSGHVAMTSTEGKTVILNNYFIMNFEVVPPAPTIPLASGAYSSTQAPIAITAAEIAGANIKYQWNDGRTYNYYEAIPVQNGTLKTWVEYTPDGEDEPLVSDIITAEYTVSYPITFAGTNSWASYFVTENLTVPEGLTAYTVDDVNEQTGVVTVSAISYIPRYEAVLLKRTNTAVSEYTASGYNGEEDDIVSLLDGTSQAASVDDILEGYVLGATVYVLYNDAFVKATGTIPANRGFLVFGEPAEAPKLTIEIGDGTTGMNDVRSQMLDVRADYFDLQGRKLQQKPSKSGLYIQNGKKVYINNK